MSTLCLRMSPTVIRPAPPSFLSLEWHAANRNAGMVISVEGRERRRAGARRAAGVGGEFSAVPSNDWVSRVSRQRRSSAIVPLAGMACRWMVSRLLQGGAACQEVVGPELTRAAPGLVPFAPRS